jgi:glutamate-1-semialdehyde 2,1-aminomutase
VPEYIASQTLVTYLDDEAAFKKVMQERGSEIAAVILEPLPANYGLLEQRSEFIRTVCAEARAAGALVIFDEVISGFRVAWGGMAERLGINPDLVTYGKVIGGGLAVGAYAGKKEFMDLVAPAGKVYQAGTLSANPLAMRTGFATLSKLRRENVYHILEQRTRDFTQKLKTILKPVEFDVSHVGSIFWLHPQTNQPIRSLKDLPAGMGDRFKTLFHHLLAKKIYLAPSGYEVGFISLAHTQPVLDEALELFAEAVRELN